MLDFARSPGRIKLHARKVILLIMFITCLALGMGEKKWSLPRGFRRVYCLANWSPTCKRGNLDSTCNVIHYPYSVFAFRLI
jgi:hypothetical protein